MFRISFLLIALTALTTGTRAQQLYMERTFGGARFDTDSAALSMHQVLEVLHENATAADEFKRAKTNYNIAGVLGFAGGLMIAMPLVTAAVGGKPEWNFAIAGGGLILISIPFTMTFYRHAEHAIDEYNKKYPAARIKTSFYMSGAGGKVIFRF